MSYNALFIDGAGTSRLIVIPECKPTMYLYRYKGSHLQFKKNSIINEQPIKEQVAFTRLTMGDDTNLIYESKEIVFGKE